MDRDIPNQELLFSDIDQGTWFFILEEDGDKWKSPLYKRATDQQLQHADFANGSNCFVFDYVDIDGDQIGGCMATSKITDDVICNVLTDDFGQEVLSELAIQSSIIIGDHRISDVVLCDLINFMNTDGGDWSCDIDQGEAILL